MPGDLTHTQHGPRQIDRQNPVPALQGDLGDRLPFDDPGIAHKDVDAAQFVNGLLNKAHDLQLVRDINVPDKNLSSQVSDLCLCEAFAVLDVDITICDINPLASQRETDVSTNPSL